MENNKKMSLKNTYLSKINTSLKGYKLPPIEKREEKLPSISIPLVELPQIKENKVDDFEERIKNRIKTINFDEYKNNKNYYFTLSFIEKYGYIDTRFYLILLVDIKNKYTYIEVEYSKNKEELYFIKYFDNYIEEKQLDLLKDIERYKTEKPNKYKQFPKEAYKYYLTTQEWKTKRDLILKRDNYICQGCLSVKATEVHHLTYDNAFDELAFQLISLCNECHKKVHYK